MHINNRQKAAQKGVCTMEEITHITSEFFSQVFIWGLANLFILQTIFHTFAFIIRDYKETRTESLDSLNEIASYIVLSCLSLATACLIAFLTNWEETIKSWMKLGNENGYFFPILIILLILNFGYLFGRKIAWELISNRPSYRRLNEKD